MTPELRAKLDRLDLADPMGVLLVLAETAPDQLAAALDVWEAGTALGRAAVESRPRIQEGIDHLQTLIGDPEDI